MKTIKQLGTGIILSLALAMSAAADGSLDGSIGPQYGATMALDDLFDGRCGNDGIDPACDRGDLVELNAVSFPADGEGFTWYLSFTVDSSQSLADAGEEAPTVFGSPCLQQATYFIGIDEACDGAPYLDMLNAPGPWARNFQWEVDYYIVVYPTGPFSLAAEMWAYEEEDVPPEMIAELPVATVVRGYRRQVEISLPDSVAVPNSLRKNLPMALMVVSTEAVTGPDGGVYDWIGGGEPMDCLESAEFSAARYFCTLPSAKATGSPADFGENDLQSLSLPIRDEAEWISSGRDCESGGSPIVVDGFVDDEGYTHLVESRFSAPYAGGSEENSDAIGEPSASRLTDSSGELTDLEGLGLQADVQQVYVSTDPDYLSVVVQGPNALGWSGLDVANLYIAIDVPIRESGTGSGSDCDPYPNAPAGRAVNFKGWDPDWVVEITDPVNALLWESDEDGGWNLVASAINMEAELSGAPLGLYYAADSEGYEVAIPWARLGYQESEFDPQTVRLSVYTTGDENVDGRSDWDVFDQAPGAGQGGTGAGAPEALADNPGDSDCSDESSLLDSDYTHGPGTSAEGTARSGSDPGLPELVDGLTIGDVDTIETYFEVVVLEEPLLCASDCVPDTIPPEVACPPQVVDECEMPMIAQTIEDFFAQGGTVDDNCDGELTIQHLGDQTFGTGCGDDPMFIEREYRIYDASGNYEDCVQEIIVHDEVPPELFVEEEIELLCGEDISPESLGYPEAEDNCGEIEFAYTDEVVNESCPLAIVRTWTATDLCGQEATAEQLIILNDVFPPEIDVIPELEATCGDDLSPEALGYPEVFDECDAGPELTYEDTIIPGDCDGQYLISRQWVAVDACGNIGDAEQTIVVSDETPPVLTVPGDVSLACGEDTSPDATGYAVAEDRCSGEVAVDYFDAVLPGPCAGSYVIERTWTAADDCGNEAGGVQTIEVTDGNAPSLTVPADATVDAGGSSDPAETGTATASDACGSVVVNYADVVSGGCPQVIVRTWTATDDCGNEVSGEQVLTFTDTTAPVISCPPAAEAPCGVDTPDPAETGFATAVDDCDGAVSVTFTDLRVPGETEQILRTWSAVDAAGNAASCEQVITLAGGGGEVSFLNCPEDLEVMPCDELPPADGVIAVDGCGQLVPVTFTETSRSEIDGWPWWIRIFFRGIAKTIITRTWTAESPSGEPVVCTQVITVRNDLACVRNDQYWLRQMNQWPVDSLTVGCETYDRSGIRDLLRGRGGVPEQLAGELAAALLNVESGACPGNRIVDAIDEAQALLCEYPLETRRLPNRVRRDMVELKVKLLAFNNGIAGSPRCR